MIHLTCRNCGWGLFGKAVMRVDAASVDITCPRCGEVYRVSVVKLHDGKPISNRAEMTYTYDNDHNRVPLGTKVSDVPGQAADAGGGSPVSPNGETQSDRRTT